MNLKVGIAYVKFILSQRFNRRSMEQNKIYGNWNSIYHKFRRWCSLGLFERLLQLINAGTKDTTLLELDSTFCKVHQSACSGRKEQAIGSSRGGKNTKVHVLINERMQLLNVVLTGGQIHDSEPALALLSGVEAVKQFLRIEHTVASKFAFSSLSMVALLVSRTKSISKQSMISTPASISNAILLSGSFSELKIFVTLPRASTNWLLALRISFYSLLLLFTFNLPTTPNYRGLAKVKVQVAFLLPQFEKIGKEKAPRFYIFLLPSPPLKKIKAKSPSQAIPKRVLSTS